MRIIFMGTPRFAVPTLERLLASEHEIVGVWTQPDRSAGRGQKLVPGPVKSLAQAHGLAVFQPLTLKDPRAIEQITSLKPEIIVLVAYGQILPQAVLDIPKFGCLNVHPSLLPKYRGASPVASAILGGDKETGVTIMLMDAGMDTGPILAQRMADIYPTETAESLEGRLSETGAELLMETLPRWVGINLRPQPQVYAQATCSRQITKADGEVDWNLSAIELSRRVRAFYPWPGCYTQWQGKVLKVLEAVVLPSSERVEPGTVVALSSCPESAVGVMTGEGVLGLCRIQLEGKKAVSAAEFLRGQRDFIGQKLG
jgi:methionyl-tRNA formyltransferase